MHEKLSTFLLFLRDYKLPWEPIDRIWYDFTGWLVTLYFGDDGRWGVYELDRNPPKLPPILCAECNEIVVLPGDHFQINADIYHHGCLKKSHFMRH